MDKILQIVGKDNFKIDSRIDKVYILRLCWKYGWMLIRGKFFSLGKKNIANNIFIGRKVKIIENKYLSIGDKTKLQDEVYIDALCSEGVYIGKNVVLGRNCRIECTGSLQYVGKGVKIGDRTTFGNDCLFGAAGGIVVGNDVVAGQYIRFHSENHNYENPSILIRNQGVTHKGIKIGNNCWVGSGAVFLDGAKVGDGCVIASNAVVTGEFGNNEVIGGIPAKIIKDRCSKMIKEIDR